MVDEKALQELHAAEGPQEELTSAAEDAMEELVDDPVGDHEKQDPGEAQAADEAADASFDFSLDLSGIEINAEVKKSAEKPAKPAQAAKSAAKPAPVAAAPKSFTYPFGVRYLAQRLDLAGFVDGQEYTEAQIKDLLIANGYTEFADMEPLFSMNAATSTLIITIKGSKKGSALPLCDDLTQQQRDHLLRIAATRTASNISGMLTRQQIERVQNLFKATHSKRGTEDRVLFYRSEEGQFFMVYPQAKKTEVEVECDLPLTITVDGVIYDLAYDLHSHHEMGAFWSDVDDANEKLRGVIFGVFSWAGGVDNWLWRTFTGQFVDLSDEGVLA